ncbi:MAG: hypothetical protein LBR16_09710 [Treponema sp.]|jgi:hypothetical protein|nr:hypothetical protein [Treponema sp.]
MLHSCANYAIPEEYRRVAAELFPADGGGPAACVCPQAARAFAGILGIEEDYRKALTASRGGAHPETGLEALLESFQNNLDLLIQKTWVDKADEIRKEKLQERIPPLIAEIKEGQWAPALEEFGSVLAELAYLFFGAQSRKEDFTEYTFRIDTQMGLFWWYGAQIGCERAPDWIKTADAECLLAVLLLGICYLTDF